MKEKKDIVENWLPRYTGTSLAEFGEHVLLTNFGGYVAWFAAQHDVAIKGPDRPMPNATADGITLINFGMGSPNAATVMDLLSAISRKPYCFSASVGSETQEQDGRSDFADCGYSRRRYLERLPAAGAARVPAATRGVNHDPRSGSRLLDRYGVHNQLTCLAARR